MSEYGRRVAVAVPVPALDLLTYQLPDGMPMPAAGARVIVPVGPRTMTGFALGPVTDGGSGHELRDVLSLLDEEAYVPAEVLELTRWVGEYYLAGPGSAISLALPPRALAARPHAFKTEQVAHLTEAGRAAADERPADAERPRLGPRQRDIIGALHDAPGGRTTSELHALKCSTAGLRRLERLGLVRLERRRIDRDPFSSGQAVSLQPPSTATVCELTPAQQQVLEQLSAGISPARFSVALLHGVTGSGKTEIYLQLVTRAVQAGRAAIVLVPEIALTPALADAFRATFGARTAVQHSGLSSGERHDQWHRIRRGEIAVVVGTRSAVFAPLSNPGLIVVDEEHDGSYKQDETPRYHGRDVAVMRGKLAGALVVLGSATPSLETRYNAAQGRYRYSRLAQRVHDRPLPSVRLVDMREEYAAEGPEVILSRPLREGIAERRQRREQVVILLNRRGIASSVLCRQCGDTFECPHCSVSLTIHGAGKRGGQEAPRAGWRARCHYCNYTQSVPVQCRHCAAPYLELVGFGTERVEQELQTHFAGLRIGRVDRDTVQRRMSLTRTLDEFRRGALDVLVGTQMIAKGHDFPRVTLVGVISADVGLAQADFRAAERTFQLLTQVAGRAGRGTEPGEAIVQTLFPGHYSIRLACTQDYEAFFEHEMTFRRAMRYPPHVGLVNVVVRGRTLERAMEGARVLAERTRGGRRDFQVLGPAPAPLQRLRTEYRAQFFLKGPSRRSMRTVLRDALAAHPEIARRTSVDIDPVSML